MVCSAWSTSQATMTTQTATVRQPLARAVDSTRNGWKQERECTGAFCTPGLRSVRPYALDCRDFCIAMPVSYLSSDVFAVCKCLILLARWETLTPWPVRSKRLQILDQIARRRQPAEARLKAKPTHSGIGCVSFTEPASWQSAGIAEACSVRVCARV